MSRAEPLHIYRSWPLLERPLQFDLGYVLEAGVDEIASLPHERELARHSVGWWECDLTDNTISWSTRVYDIFGLERGSAVSRDDAAAMYCEGSRAAMERLRAYAIKHRRGFTLDAEIAPVNGERRWMRLIGAPVSENGAVVRLQGLKLIL